tara:strand:+ start:1523 stop:2149 length:627 start_codon:yes stop_codon:yes gene_type:complete
MKKQYGRLTVVKELKKINYKKIFLCKCSCGNETETRFDHLRDGSTKSCGCLKRELATKRMTKHGEAKSGAKSTLFNAWCAMKGRCYNKNNQDYKTYGARGITVYEGWIDNFSDFSTYVNKELGERPNKYSLDRIDNNKGYEPNNLKWSSPTEQVRNRSCSRVLAFKGETLSLKEWSERTGIQRRTIHARIYQLNWTVEKTLTTIPKRS